ncbi:MAG: hypothetical protein NTV93_17395 [Verrucomicrobia bacterium]|nr:hypothetical protein [Verrucomicrobiota bacterium]
MRTFPSLQSWQTAAVLGAAFLAFLTITACAADPVPAKLDPPVVPSLSGSFVGNGKEAALKYVLVEDHEPFSGEEAKAPAGPLLSARTLPLPDDAADVEYKEVVEQIGFSIARPVDAVAKEFSAKLKQQGWKDGPGNLMGKNNAILKREKGDAKLTIMVQPAPKGCVVKIFTEGMDWSGGDGDEKPSATTKPADADDIGNQANKLIKDALKSLPKGL